jgi:hypothetical protein
LPPTPWHTEQRSLKSVAVSSAADNGAGRRVILSDKTTEEINSLIMN